MYGTPSLSPPQDAPHLALAQYGVRHLLFIVFRVLSMARLQATFCAILALDHSLYSRWTCQIILNSICLLPGLQAKGPITDSRESGFSALLL